jgi:hypothetical protein
LTPHSRIFGRGTGWAAMTGASLMIICGVLYLVAAGNPLHTPVSALFDLTECLFQCFFYSVFIAVGISIIWWNRTMQLREYGVLFGKRLLRWSHVTDGRWDGDSLCLEGVDERQRDVRFRMSVPDDQREAIEGFLAERLGEMMNSSSLDQFASPPVAARCFPLMSIRQRLVRTSLVILPSFAFGILIASQMFRGVSREFGYGLFAGVFAMIAVGSAGAQRARRAGPPRVRLSLRVDWPVLLGSLALAAACYDLASFLTFTDVWLNVLAGVACGAASVFAISLIANNRLDLCDNGAIVRGWTFWPWHVIRVKHGARAGEDRLLLHNGWRRVLAIVPPEQRPAVDALLKEKFGKRS